MAATFEASDGSQYNITPVRFVRPVFDVIHYSGDNAVAVVEWLYNRSKSGTRFRLDVYLKMTDGGLRLVRGFDHVEIESGSYIGFGTPPRGASDDVPTIIAVHSESVKQPCELAGDGIERWPSS